MIVLQFMQVFGPDTKRIYDHLIVFIKLHEIDAAESSCVLILFSSCQFQIISFNFIGIVGDIVITQGQASAFP